MCQQLSPYCVRIVLTADGERLPVLLSREDGIPIFDPTVWSISELRGRQVASNTILQALRSLVFLYLVLDGWSGKLTWALLIERICLQLHIRYTRQALHSHIRIKEAFNIRKRSLAGRKQEEIETELPELQFALQRIARLEAENERIKSENNRLLEQFVRWAYNASTRALDEKFLNQPLTPVHREPSIRLNIGDSNGKGRKK